MHNNLPAEPNAPDAADPKRPVLEPSWFNRLTGGLDRSATRAREVIESIASQIEYQSRWCLETGPGGEITLKILSHDPRNSLTLAITLTNHELILAITPDPSGWLRITIHPADAAKSDEPLFECWLDQPYEEFEFWPGIHDPANTPSLSGPTPIAPGRMGKRMNWISIEATAWPSHSIIHRLSNSHGFVVASQADEN
ncbi:hypothetical protein [Orrella marina]|uniref:Uncharacterized protein n=1 Tax=Orrella marina TaxID=2163011 RepID=A0A2R4XI02_9BURK|nr:hypothetical protein [Orrella marina]AWB33408.1 hypothetical protein DBV39_06475 [Orrella marina]